VEPVSQLILRNEARIPSGPVVLVNPPRDALLRELERSDRPVRASTQDFGDFRWLMAAGADARFEAIPTFGPGECSVILCLPREKDRLDMLLHAIAAQLAPQAGLWLVGENHGGIKSSARHLRRHFGLVATVANARHCGLLEAAGLLETQPFHLDDYAVEWVVSFASKTIRLCSLPGVFAHGRLDPGTRLLLDTLEDIRPGGRVLDFACGSGVIGLAVLSGSSRAELTLLDSSALALESSRRSLAINSAGAELLPSDGLSELTGRFDWIVSNPPFHRGIRNDLSVAEEFFHRAGTFLTERGKIVVVFNRHLPYFRWLQTAFDRVERLVGSGEFAVIQASRRSG